MRSWKRLGLSIFDMGHITQFLIIYLIAINIIAFSMYGIDKRRARQGQWRIPEKTLLAIAVVGGSVGAFAGMHIFHHKTKHWYFRYGLPTIMIAQIAAVVYLRMA